MGGKEGSSGGYVSVSGNAKKLYDPANAFCLIRNVLPNNATTRSQTDRQKVHRSRPRTNRSDDTKARVQPELTFRTLSHLLIVFLDAI